MSDKVEELKVQDTKAINEKIKKSIADKIKSKSLKVTGTFGTSSLFDLGKHTDLDYSAGGQLHTRFVKNDQGSIARRKIEGYYMPQELDANLTNIEFGGLTLMVRPEELRKQHEQGLRAEADKVSGNVMAKSDIAKQHKDKFVEFDTSKQTKVIGAYK